MQSYTIPQKANPFSFYMPVPWKQGNEWECYDLHIEGYEYLDEYVITNVRTARPGDFGSVNLLPAFEMMGINLGKNDLVIEAATRSMEADQEREHEAPSELFQTLGAALKPELLTSKAA